MARKNNKKNRRRVTFYGISKFDYEARENLVKGQLPPKENPTEEDKKVESSPENTQTETQTPKITIIQTNSRKAQADEFEHLYINNRPFKGLET